jgi:hypothetical protein
MALRNTCWIFTSKEETNKFSDEFNFSNPSLKITFLVWALVSMNLGATLCTERGTEFF